MEYGIHTIVSLSVSMVLIQPTHCNYMGGPQSFSMLFCLSN